MKTILLLLICSIAIRSHGQRFYCQSDADCGPWASCYEGGQCIGDQQNGFVGASRLQIGITPNIKARCISVARQYANMHKSPWASLPQFAGTLYNSCYVSVSHVKPDGSRCHFKYNIDLKTWKVRNIEDVGCGTNNY